MTVAAIIKNDDGTVNTTICHFNLYTDNEQIAHIQGILNNDVWEFYIPKEVTENLRGRYWYSICDEKHTRLNFKQPIYLG